MDINKTTITTRIDRAFTGLQEEFRGIYDSNDFEVAIEDVIKAKGRTSYSTKLRNLYEMLDACDIQYEKGKDAEYYVDLLRNQVLPSFDSLEDRMMLALYTRYNQYPSPEQYMERLVNRLCNEEDGWEGDTLRVRILKQFIKYANSLSDAGYAGLAYVKRYANENGAGKTKDMDKMLCYVDDHVFDVLANATRDQRRPRGTYGILKAADDLALGKFRTEGATKVLLYLFAMAFNMTYYSGTGRGQYFYKASDIDVNLFRDYYANNFLRFITEAYIGRLNEYDTDPSGQGINYKNYAEMVYLYYINKELEPAEKIRKATEMITRIKEKMKGASFPGDEEEGGAVKTSGDYKKFFVKGTSMAINSEDILSLDEESFEEFLCSNYDCDSSKCNNSPIMIGTTQNSAFEAYKEILSLIEEEGRTLESCNYGLWFTDIAGFFSRSNKKYAESEDFVRLLHAINNYIGVTTDEKPSSQNPEDARDRNEATIAKTKALFISSPSEVTRAAMVTTYYYYFNAVHENDDVDGSISFEDLFTDFKEGIDPFLERAHYNPFSGRDLFDVITAFSSYAFIYI